MPEGSEAELDIDLRHYLQVLSRRRWIIISVFVVAVLSSALYVSTARPVYSSTAMVLIEKEQRSQSYREEPVIEATADDYYQTQYKLLKSRSLLKKVYDSLRLSDQPDFARGLGALDAAVLINPIRRSRLVNVTVESHDPELACRVANALSGAYVEQNLESKLFISKDVLEALFPEQAPPEKRSGRPIQLDTLPAVVQSPLIQNLKGLYANLETRLGDISRRYTPEHPEMVRLRSQMDALKARIKDETDKIVTGVKADLSGQLLGNNIRIVDPAETPTSPSKPRKLRTLLIAAILGLLGGYLLALGVDALDQTVHTQEDVENKVGLPFLGSIPSVQFTADSAQGYSDLLAGPKSFAGESLKNIRTMIGFAAAGKEMRSLLITSTAQGEGKTFIAISLAMVFSQLGEKVLLIEGDLRRPNLHKRFGLPKDKGLSHFLAHSRSADEAGALIQQTPDSSLDLLICGHIPPNPAELLSTPKLSGLMAWAEGRYDRVIVDGTPVFPITDALLWSRHCDAGVFVLRFGSTNGTLALRAQQKIAESGLKVAGAIVNRVTAKARAYGDYYYYYYYYSDYAKEPKDVRPSETTKQV